MENERMSSVVYSLKGTQQTEITWQSLREENERGDVIGYANARWKTLERENFREQAERGAAS